MADTRDTVIANPQLEHREAELKTWMFVSNLESGGHSGLRDSIRPPVREIEAKIYSSRPSRTYTKRLFYALTRRRRQEQRELARSSIVRYTWLQQCCISSLHGARKTIKGPTDNIHHETGLPLTQGYRTLNKRLTASSRLSQRFTLTLVKY